MSKMVSLVDVCTAASSNIAQKDLTENNGVYPIYGASGFIKNVNFYKQDKPYLAIVKDGAGVGRVSLLPEQSSVIGTMQYILPNERVDINFLYYVMINLNLARYYSGATIPHIYFKDYKKEQFPLLPLNEQRQIASVLNRINEIIAERRRQLEQLDLMVKSRFAEMFGDPVTNPMGWEVKSLGELAHVVSGITKGRKTKETALTEVPYMAVSNVKDGYIDWTTVKSIEATQSEIKQYRLLPYDILMTEGGDPDKLGRGAMIVNPPKDCIHQNHIYRVRLDDSQMLPAYFAEYLQHPRSKQYFLRCAKQTTGIATINMTQLRALPVLLPDIQLQRRFADFVRVADKSKFKMRQGLKQLELQYSALMQRYFG
jgi:type I restriction enzyme S subunit